MFFCEGLHLHLVQHFFPPETWGSHAQYPTLVLRSTGVGMAAPMFLGNLCSWNFLRAHDLDTTLFLIPTPFSKCGNISEDAG